MNCTCLYFDYKLLRKFEIVVNFAICQPKPPYHRQIIVYSCIDFCGGHESVLTTEIYARMNPKYMFEAIKNAYKNIITDNIPVWEGNDELMEMLKGLAK